MSYTSLHFGKKPRLIHAKGFGLVELMVSISIMALITGIVFARQGSFNGSVLLQNQAFEVALTFREAQQNAVSVVGVSQNFQSRVGVHVSSIAASNGIYTLFRDNSLVNGFLDTGEAFGPQGVLDSRFEIRAIRSITNGVSTNQTALAVVFQRPNFDARFFVAANNELTTASSVEIDIGRRNLPGGTVRTVVITRAGQVSVR